MKLGFESIVCITNGTIPVVNNTGGLHDTIVDISEPNGYGIKMSHASENEIILSIYRAIELYRNL